MYTLPRKGQGRLTKETRGLKNRIAEVLENGLLRLERDKDSFTGEKVLRLVEIPELATGDGYLHGVGGQRELHVLAKKIAGALLARRGEPKQVRRGGVGEGEGEREPVGEVA